jgi:iron complex transport system substrate-binding protein
MRKFIPIGIALCLLLPILPGCGFEEAPIATAGKEVTIIDKTGSYVEFSVPVERIVSINSGMSALICAFGDGDKIVGRDSYSTFPSYMRDVLEIGRSSASPNIELILEQRPDVVIADTMLKDDQREKLEAAGVPVMLDITSDLERLIPLIRNIGLMLDKKERADEIVGFIGNYCDIIDERVAGLTADEKPLVFFQRRNLYDSASALSSYNKPLVATGSVNIAADEPVPHPKLSAEWVLERNPEVIVNRISGDDTLDEMEALRDEIMLEPGLAEVSAVKEERVYIIKADVFLAVRYPVGLLYYAKWFHPDLFQDIDPGAIHKELIEKFYSEEEWQNFTECFAFPES